ncbi:MAG: hypothetical protein MZV70_14075 [Desulfobacterales bacterium]|nr:hypothetical protein [Desulfobacterales bacterium]
MIAGSEPCLFGRQCEVPADQHDARDEPMTKRMFHDHKMVTGLKKVITVVKKCGTRSPRSSAGTADDEYEGEREKGPFRCSAGVFFNKEITLPAVAPAEHAGIHPFPLLI